MKPMNLVDFLAILPYFISAVIDSLQDLHILSKAGKVGTGCSKKSTLNADNLFAINEFFFVLLASPLKHRVGMRNRPGCYINHQWGDQLSLFQQKMASSSSPQRSQDKNKVPLLDFKRFDFQKI